MKTAISGPHIVYGDRSPTGTGATGSNNPDKAPSTYWGGTGVIDPRAGYNMTKAGCVGWAGNTNSLLVIDQAPATLSATNLSAAAVPVAGTALTLAGAATGVALVAAGGFYSPASGLTVPANALVLDTLPTLFGFGRAAQSNSSQKITTYYDPTKAVERNLRFTSVGDDSAATIAIVGYDLYGFLVHETLALTNATIASSLRTYKFIVSLTPAGTLSGSNLSAGTGDVYGMHFQSLKFMMTEIFWNSAYITATTGYTAAVTTDPATATTGSVRGKYGVQSASDGTKQLQVFQTIPLANIPNINGAASLFGIAQF